SDLLREGVLVEVDEHQDVPPGADPDDGGDAVEIAPIVAARARLDGAPADRQAQQVEPEPAHALGVAGVEYRDRLERRAAVVEGHVEHALDARVHAAQRDLAAAPRAHAAP